MRPRAAVLGLIAVEIVIDDFQPQLHLVARLRPRRIGHLEAGVGLPQRKVRAERIEFRLGPVVGLERESAQQLAIGQRLGTRQLVRLGMLHYVLRAFVQLLAEARQGIV